MSILCLVLVGHHKHEHQVDDEGEQEGQQPHAVQVIENLEGFGGAFELVDVFVFHQLVFAPHHEVLHFFGGAFPRKIVRIWQAKFTACALWMYQLI